MPASRTRSKIPKRLRRLTRILQPSKATEHKDPLRSMAPEQNDSIPLHPNLHILGAAEGGYKGPSAQQHHTQLSPIPTKPTPMNIPKDYNIPSLLNPALRSLAQEAGLAFLTPVESSVLATILRSKRCSRFRPILAPETELLLVQQPDLLPFQFIQAQVKDLPDDEKALLEKDIWGYLLQQQRYVLGILLWNPGIVVTTSTVKEERELKEGFERPTSEEMFGPWRREWGEGMNEGKGFMTFSVLE